MEEMNEEQEEFLRQHFEQVGYDDDFMRNGGAMPIDQHRSFSTGLSTLRVDKEDRKLLDSLDLVRSTKQSSEIIRKLLIRAGTDCDKNDADSCGDGDQSIVENESQAQILRELFADGGDFMHWLAEYPFGISKLSPFVWMCIKGDAEGVEKILKKTPLTQRRGLLEQRVTSMRFSLLILVVAVSKHPHTRMVHRYTARPLHQMDHVGVVRVLLHYGARPNAREATGKTVCHYGAGAFATKETLIMTDFAMKANKTSSCVWKKVLLDGLSKQEYNGLEGILGGYVAETGRRVFYPRDLNKKQLSVKPDNVFLVSKDGKTKTCITSRLLRPTNLAEVGDRTGAISLHEITFSDRNDVAKFLLDRSPRCLDVEDHTGTSPRRMTSIPVLGSKVNDILKERMANQADKKVRKVNMREESCEHCGKRSSELGYELLQCIGCLSACYCSKDCQVADWKVGNHKRECPEREKQSELVLGEASNLPQASGCQYYTTNYSTNTTQDKYRYGPPKCCKLNDKFWVKVQSNGVDGDLYIYDQSRHCCFYLAPGSAGHKELAEKVAEERTFEGRKSYFLAKFNDSGKCVVFLHSSRMQEW